MRMMKGDKNNMDKGGDNGSGDMRDNSYDNSYDNGESRSNGYDDDDNNNNECPTHNLKACHGDSRKSDCDNDNGYCGDSSPEIVGFILKDSNSLQSDMRGFNYFKLYMAGELLLVNDGGWWIRRYAEVRGGHLVIYRHRYRLDGYKFFDFKIRLSNLNVVPQQMPKDTQYVDRYQFALISEQDSHVFQVEKFNVFVKWLNAISMENLKQTSILEVRRLQTFGVMQLRKSISKQPQKVTRRADSAPARLETVPTTLNNSNKNGSSVWRLWVAAPEKQPIRKFDSLPSDINVFQVSVKEKKRLFEKLSSRYSMSVDNLSSERETSKNQQERAQSTHDLRTLKLTPVSRRRQFFELRK